ncbi:hypothetical protein ACOMHN_044963 [Nucella lapillus]
MIDEDNNKDIDDTVEIHFVLNSLTALRCVSSVAIYANHALPARADRAERLLCMVWKLKSGPNCREYRNL